MKSAKIRILFGLAVVVLYGLTTGGLVIMSQDDFGGQTNISLAGGLKSDIWLAPTRREFSVPFVFHYMRGGNPLNLRLQIWDGGKRYKTVVITEILLEYADGEVALVQEPWSRELRPYTHYGSSSGELIKEEMHMLSDTINDLPLRHSDVRITLKGCLESVDGRKVSFSATESFRTESSSRLATYWHVLTARQYIRSDLTKGLRSEDPG